MEGRDSAPVRGLEALHHAALTAYLVSLARDQQHK